MKKQRQHQSNTTEKYQDTSLILELVTHHIDDTWVLVNIQNAVEGIESSAFKRLFLMIGSKLGEIEGKQGKIARQETQARVGQGPPAAPVRGHQHQHVVPAAFALFAPVPALVLAPAAAEENDISELQL